MVCYSYSLSKFFTRVREIHPFSGYPTNTAFGIVLYGNLNIKGERDERQDSYQQNPGALSEQEMVQRGEYNNALKQECERRPTNVRTSEPQDLE